MILENFNIMMLTWEQTNKLIYRINEMLKRSPDRIVQRICTTACFAFKKKQRPKDSQTTPNKV
jgi:hypothetical protein